jgi:zinc/manganese transport system ATP-binding protein
MPALVELHSVRVEHGPTVALDHLTLTIDPGSSYAIVGPNGSGKSTLLGVLAGVQLHTRGRVERARGARIALVPQSSAVTDRLPLTVRDTVVMGRWGPSAGGGRRADREAVGASLRALDLEGLQHRALASLSGGQRQRALVAQGLARRADVLLLDEPGNSLDERAQELIRIALELELSRGATVVQATHDPAIIATASRTIALRAGIRVLTGQV